MGDADHCVGYSLISGWRCTRPATLRAIVGCKHEHVGPRLMCGGHLDDVRRGMHFCGECDELGHRCLLTAHQVDSLSPPE